MSNKIHKIFSKAYVLGGSPCSGKSTIAGKLSTQYGFEYYKVDDHEKSHMRRVQLDQHPVMSAYSQMSWDEIWMRSVALQVQEELDYYRERFEMIIADLLAYAENDPILLEGAAYLPELLVRNQFDPKRVLYMVPTKSFQVEHYSKRPWIKQILKDCTNPNQAFENWMARDFLFAQEIAKQAKQYGYRVVTVAGNRNIETQYAQVVEYLGLA
jgi:2-phosphoglycerate kinase